MKKFFVLILALIVTTSVFSQQIYNSLTVKNLFVPTSATFNNSFSGVAKLSSGVLSASPLVNADVSNSAAISYTKLSGVVDTSTAQSISGNKSFLNNFSVTGTTTLATSLSGYLKATAGVVSSVSQVDLSTDVVGTLPITNGGTGSTSKSWVDLTTNQSGIAGNKAFVSNLSTSGTMLASNLSGTNTGDLITQGVTGLNSAVTNILEFPLNQVTTTATGTRRVDTGNGNVLANSSFESSTVGLGWQATNVTLANSTTNIQDGVKSIQITSTTNNWSFDYQSSLYPSAKAGQSAEGSLWVQSTGTGSNDIWLCEGSYTATPVLGPCDKYDGSGLPRQLKIYTPFKSTGSGIRLMGNTSGTVIHADSAKFDNRNFSYSNINWQGDKSFSYACSGNANVTCAGSYSIVGNKIFLNFRATWTGNGNTSALVFTLPDGLSFAGSSPISTPLTPSYVLDVGSQEYVAETRVYSSNQIIIRRMTTTSATAYNPIGSDNLFPFTPVSGDFGYVNIVADLAGKDIGNAAVASESVQVSSDTMNFVFKSTAIVDADPVGTYNTYTIAASGNLPVLATTAPTQTIASMNSDGFRIFARPFGSAGTAASPARVDIKIGKDLKSNKVLAYVNTGKNLPVSFDFYQANATTLSGARVVYNATTGILTIDAAMDQLGGSSTRYIGMDVISPANPFSAYFTFSASRYADIASIPVFEYSDARFSTTSAQTIVDANWNIINYNVLELDTHNAVTTGASWKYTAPFDSWCSFQAVATKSTSSSIPTHVLTVFKNGSQFSSGEQKVYASSVGVLGSVVSTSFRLAKSEYVDARLYSNGGTLATSPTYNNIAISCRRLLK